MIHLVLVRASMQSSLFLASLFVVALSSDGSANSLSGGGHVETQRSAAWETLHSLGYSDVYMKALENVLADGTIKTAAPQRKRRSANSLLKNWLSSKLGDMSEDGLVHDFIFDGLGRNRILARLEERFGKAEAERILGTLNTVLDGVQGNHQRYGSHIDVLVRANETIKTAIDKDAALETSYYRKRRLLKHHVIQWLTAQMLGDAQDRAKGAARDRARNSKEFEIAHEYIYHRTGRPEVVSRLSDAIGIKNAHESLTSIDRLVAELPARADALASYKAKADQLLGDFRGGHVTYEELRLRRTALRKSASSWLARKLGGSLKGKRLAADFISFGRAQNEVMERLVQKLGKTKAERLSTFIVGFKEAFDELQKIKQGPIFPFAYKQINLIREFVPPGFLPVLLNDIENAKVVDFLAHAANGPKQPEVLSVFKPKGPWGSYRYVVFRDANNPSNRGLAKIGRDTVTAIRVFNSSRR